MHSIVGIALSLAGVVCVWNYVLEPTFAYRSENVGKIREAVVYMRHHCIDKADIRVQIGDFDHCRDAERRIESWPLFDAWVRVLGDYKICPRRSCLLFAGNYFELIGYLVGALVALFLLGVGLYIIGVIRSIYEAFVVRTTLPMHVKKAF